MHPVKKDGRTERFILVAAMQGSECNLKMTIIIARKEAEESFLKAAMLSSSIISGDSSVSK
jgi:hypothetical protein